MHRQAQVQTQAYAQGERPRVCVLGGGFGGLYTALRLRGLSWPSSEAVSGSGSTSGRDEYEYMLRRVSAGLRPPQLLFPNESTRNSLSARMRGDSGTERSDMAPEVILVDKSDRFIFKPLLYELLLEDAAVWEVCPRYEDLLAGTGITFIQDEVTSVESTSGEGEGGRVRVSSGRDLEYDWLVVALGAGPSALNVPGAKENAIPFATLDHALKISTRLAKIQTSRRSQSSDAEKTVVVVGGGVSGVEVASTIAQRLSNERAKVIILHGGDTVMGEAPTKQRESACKVLERRGVEIRTNFRVTSIDSIDDDKDSMNSRGYDRSLVTGAPVGVQSGSDAQSFTADLVVWTAGQSPLSGPLVDAFPKTEKGAVEIEPTLQVKGLSRVFAMGDVVVRSSSSSSSGQQANGNDSQEAEYGPKPLPATAQVAFQQADYAAWNIWASINGKSLLPFRYQHLGDMMLLGTRDAAMTPLGIDGLTVDGPLAAAARKAAYLYRMPTANHAAKVGASWALKPIIQYLSSRGF